MTGTSTAYIILKDRGWKYTFDGVVSIAHSLVLKVSKDSESSSSTDYVNNARNEPDVVTLSVVASDANASIDHWSSQFMRSLAAIKEGRILCQVITSIRAYDDMLLSDISVLQDETCPYGWTGVLTFTHVDIISATTKTEDNSSTAVSSGNSAASSVSGSSRGGSTFLTILREAGIRTS